MAGNESTLLTNEYLFNSRNESLGEKKVDYALRVNTSRDICVLMVTRVKEVGVAVHWKE